MKYFMRDLQVLVTIKISSKVLWNPSHNPKIMFGAVKQQSTTIFMEDTSSFGEDIVTSLLIKTKTEAPPMTPHCCKHQNQGGNTRKKKNKKQGKREKETKYFRETPNFNCTLLVGKIVGVVTQSHRSLVTNFQHPIKAFSMHLGDGLMWTWNHFPRILAVYSKQARKQKKIRISLSLCFKDSLASTVVTNTFQSMFKYAVTNLHTTPSDQFFQGTKWYF